MPRSRTSQTKHDREVSRQARSYKSRDYYVEADVPGYPTPDTIGGYRPDVYAGKGGHDTVVEVETPDSVDSARDKAQQRAFKQWASRKDTRHFRRVVTD